MTRITRSGRDADDGFVLLPGDHFINASSTLRKLYRSRTAASPVLVAAVVV